MGEALRPGRDTSEQCTDDHLSHAGHRTVEAMEAPMGRTRNKPPGCGANSDARGLGFEPHADFAKAAGHLGEWDGVCDLEFGRDGMPMYIEGPHDDTWRIMHTLRQNVGDGNFHYLAGLRP